MGAIMPEGGGRVKRFRNLPQRHGEEEIAQRKNLLFCESKKEGILPRDAGFLSL
jgi:hypothetical protein